LILKATAEKITAGGKTSVVFYATLKKSEEAGPEAAVECSDATLMEISVAAAAEHNIDGFLITSYDQEWPAY